MWRIPDVRMVSGVRSRDVAEGPARTRAPREQAPSEDLYKQMLLLLTQVEETDLELKFRPMCRAFDGFISLAGEATAFEGFEH
jgi:hypothetical protein